MNQLKNLQIGILALLITISTEDKTMVEIFKNGNSFFVKQISAISEKEKVNIGKMIGKELIFNEKSDYKGIVVDPSNNKEYKALFTVADDGKSLRLKVKWGFIGFNETWKKM
jgi:uncharacterized protein (DUF2147 family)